MASEKTPQSATAQPTAQDREIKLQAENDRLKKALSEARENTLALEKRAAGTGELERKVQALSGDLKKATDLAKAEAKRANAAEKDASELRDRMQQTATSTLTNLPEGACQLRESVTVTGVGGVRVDAHAGDVLFVGKAEDAAAMQREAGRAYGVHLVPASVIDEVRALGMLKG